MCVAFALQKLLTFFQQKISMYLPYFKIEILTSSYLTTSFKIEILTSRYLTTSLSFEQLGPGKLGFDKRWRHAASDKRF